MRLALLCAGLCAGLFAGLGLAACSPPPATTTQTPTATTAETTGATTNPVVTPEGYGGIRIGMTIAEAEAAIGHPLAMDEAPYDAAECATFRITPEDGAIFLAESGRVSRVTFHTGRVRTPEGAGVGQSSDEVRAVYGPRAIRQAAKYNPDPAHDLIVWATPRTSGYRFEVDALGRVGILHAGTASGIQLVEGCA